MKKLYYFLPISLVITLFTPATAQDLTTDSLALVDFAGNINGLSWNFADPVDTWEGISIENNRVSAIQLADKNLTGTIFAAIDSLSALQLLDLSNNNFGDTLPVTLGNLSNLDTLLLQNNQFTGAIPETFVNLSNLKWMNISHNQLEKLPDISDLGTLDSIIVTNNQLSFDDILPNVSLPLHYNPQDTLGMDSTFVVRLGDTIKLDLKIDTAIVGNAFIWYKDGNSVDISALSHYTIESIIPDKGGIYHCQIQNAMLPDLILISANFTVIVDCPLSINVLSTMPITCIGDSTGSFTVQGNDGFVPYQYALDSANYALDSTFSGLPTGTYTVYLMDSLQCMDTLSVVMGTNDVLRDTLMELVHNTCHGDDTAKIVLKGVGGVEPYRYRLDTASDFSSNFSFEQLSSGVHEIIIQDSLACMDTTIIFIQPFPFVTTINSLSGIIDCDTVIEGSVTLATSGGTYPYTYLWQTGETDSILTTLIADDYVVEIADANGCKDTLTVPMEEYDSINVTIDTSDYNGYAISCNGAADAFVTIESAAPSPFFLRRENLSADTFRTQFTDQFGCIVNIVVPISEPPLLQLTTHGTSVSGDDESSGEAVVIPVGGTPFDGGVYLYEWSDPERQTTRKARDLTVGLYTVTVTDENGCQAVDSVQINQANSLFPTITPNFDGSNDYFTVPNLNVKDKNELIVTNRYGSIIFQQKGYVNTWAGTTSDNVPLPQGVYYYVFIRNDKERFRGTVTVLR